MSVSDLKASLTEAAPPANLSQPLTALWWVAKGD